MNPIALRDLSLEQREVPRMQQCSGIELGEQNCRCRPDAVRIVIKVTPALNVDQAIVGVLSGRTEPERPERNRAQRQWIEITWFRPI